MAGRRSYADLCGIARALDVIGERWALLIVRELILGPKRFTDLRTGLPGVSPDVLAQRLRELESSGVVRRATLPPPAASHVYELTERGQALQPVILELGRWGSEVPFPPGDTQFGVDAVVLALMTLFDPSVADGLRATYQLRLGGQRFLLRVSDGRLTVERVTGDPGADLTLESDPPTLAAVLWHDRPVDDAERAGVVVVSGERKALARFLTLFPQG